MATFIKGIEVPNATSYELAEKASDGAYNVLASKNEINFELDSLGLAAGKHTLVVKAKADGWEDSDYSNEVIYTTTAEWNGTIGVSPVLVSATGAVLEDGYTLDSMTYKTNLRNTAFTYKDIPVEAGATYYSEGAGRLWFLDSDKNGLSTHNASNTAPYYTFTVPSGAVYVSLSYVPEATGVTLTASEVTIKKVV